MTNIFAYCFSITLKYEMFQVCRYYFLNYNYLVNISERLISFNNCTKTNYLVKIRDRHPFLTLPQSPIYKPYTLPHNYPNKY